MRTPLLVVGGMDTPAMAATAMSLMWDLPDAVAVQHRIDPETQVLTRTVSDISGNLEHHETQLEHACATCALREDILPTLERLAQEHRWSAILVCLPVAIEVEHFAQIVSTDPKLARLLRLARVIVALGEHDPVEDLLGRQMLHERGLHSGPHDERGVAEVACDLVEYADIVVLGSHPSPEEADLVRALARPEAEIRHGAETLDGLQLAGATHRHLRASNWCVPMNTQPLPVLGESHAWRMDLTSDRPLDPDRLLDDIERLGGGTFRSRGCFWVSTRPHDAQHWRGAGGQLSIGMHCPWQDDKRLTRLVLTGLGRPPEDLVDIFHELLDRRPASPQSTRWCPPEDGLEPWLGPIRDVA